MRTRVKFLNIFMDMTGTLRDEVEFEGRTIRDLVRVLVEKYPRLKEVNFEDREQVLLIVNGRVVDSLDSELPSDAEVTISAPALGG